MQSQGSILDVRKLQIERTVDMSSQIELYPHNQIAYDKLCDMLAHSDRACVI